MGEGEVLVRYTSSPPAGKRDRPGRGAVPENSPGGGIRAGVLLLPVGMGILLTYGRCLGRYLQERRGDRRLRHHLYRVLSHPACRASDRTLPWVRLRCLICLCSRSYLVDCKPPREAEGPARRNRYVYEARNSLLLPGADRRCPGEPRFLFSRPLLRENLI